MSVQSPSPSPHTTTINPVEKARLRDVRCSMAPSRALGKTVARGTSARIGRARRTYIPSTDLQGTPLVQDRRREDGHRASSGERLAGTRSHLPAQRRASVLGASRRCAAFASCPAPTRRHDRTQCSMTVRAGDPFRGRKKRFRLRERRTTDGRGFKKEPGHVFKPPSTRDDGHPRTTTKPPSRPRVRTSCSNALDDASRAQRWERPGPWEREARRDTKPIRGPQPPATVVATRGSRVCVLFDRRTSPVSGVYCGVTRVLFLLAVDVNTYRRVQRWPATSESERRKKKGHAYTFHESPLPMMAVPLRSPIHASFWIHERRRVPR